MLKITVSPFCDIKDPSTLDDVKQEIEKHLSAHHVNLPSQLQRRSTLAFSVNVKREQSDVKADTSVRHMQGSVLLTYVHPDNPSEENTIVKKGDVGDLLALVDAAIHSAANQLTCEHHWVRPSNARGLFYPDGRRQCERCDLETKTGLPPLPGQHVVSMSFGADEISQFDWGSDTFLQGGTSGLVMSKDGNHYTTAFFEAFPHYPGGLSTFLRGEGDNLQAAEAQCWEKHQRILSCKAHQWTRSVNGRDRDDGYAQCTNCGLCDTALPPLTTCEKCHRPTSLHMNDKRYLCPTHFYEQDDQILINDIVAAHLSYRDSYDVGQLTLKSTLCITVTANVHRAFLSALSVDHYDEYRSRIEQFANHLLHLVKHAAHKMTLHEAETCSPDGKDDVTQRCLAHFIAHVPDFIASLHKKERKPTLPNTFFIPADFINRNEPAD